VPPARQGPVPDAGGSAFGGPLAAGKHVVGAGAPVAC